MSTPKRAPRQRLIDAMIEVSAREGYSESSIADVIEAASASRSTFYEHFADRDDCFLAALADIADDVVLTVKAAVGDRGRREDASAEAGAGDAEPARATVAALMGFAEGSPAAARLLFLESLAAGPQAMALRDTLIDQLAETIEQGWAQRSEELEACDVPALGLMCGLFRLLSMRLTSGEAALHGLEDDLIAWVSSYSRQSGPFSWRTKTALGRIATLAAPPAPEAPAPQILPRGRHGLSAAEVALSQRQRIMAAVASEAFQHGYANVTVTGIVSAASISRNVFYEQFSDKQDAAIAALQDGFERAFASTAGSFFAGDSWPQRIWAIGERLTEHYLSHPADAYLSFVELHAIGEEAIRLAHERLRVFTLLLEEGYSLRSSKGLGPLPRLVSEALVATVLELGYRQAPHKGAKTRPVLLGQQAYMCLAPFIGPEEASGLVAERLGQG